MEINEKTKTTTKHFQQKTQRQKNSKITPPQSVDHSTHKISSTKGQHQ